MMRFCAEPALAARMGRQSRIMAEERFDVIKVNERIYDILSARDEQGMPNQTEL